MYGIDCVDEIMGVYLCLNSSGCYIKYVQLLYVNHIPIKDFFKKEVHKLIKNVFSTRRKVYSKKGISKYSNEVTYYIMHNNIIKC